LFFSGSSGELPRGIVELGLRPGARTVDPDLITEAMELALELSYNEFRGASPVAVTDAWLSETFATLPYDQPSGIDPDGFVTVGEHTSS
jgi:hypothetical protein